jgi:hypothetical protein
MAVSQRTTQRAWSAVSVALACVIVTACNRNPKDQVWTSPTGPTPETQPVAVRGTVLALSGEPIAGALVRSVTGTGVNQTTDANGRFDLGTFNATIRVLQVDVSKTGFAPLTVYININTTVIDIPLKLRPMAPLPVDGSITVELLPTDPPAYVGEDYDSDYSSNTRYYGFVTGHDEIVVDLEWDHSVTTTLKMWALYGSLVSQASGTHEVLRLPPHRAGILLVGSPNGLTAPVRFKLTAR